MAAGQSAADILAGAKETLSKANALSDSVEKEKEKAAPPTPHTSVAPKHEYSSAPYSIAKEAGDLGKGLKATLEMKGKAQKALE